SNTTGLPAVAPKRWAAFALFHPSCWPIFELRSVRDMLVRPAAAAVATVRPASGRKSPNPRAPMPASRTKNQAKRRLSLALFRRLCFVLINQKAHETADGLDEKTAKQQRCKGREWWLIWMRKVHKFGAPYEEAKVWCRKSKHGQSLEEQKTLTLHGGS